MVIGLASITDVVISNTQADDCFSRPTSVFQGRQVFFKTVLRQNQTSTNGYIGRVCRSRQMPALRRSEDNAPRRAGDYLAGRHPERSVPADAGPLVRCRKVHAAPGGDCPESRRFSSEGDAARDGECVRLDPCNIAVGDEDVSLDDDLPGPLACRPAQYIPCTGLFLEDRRLKKP